MVADDLIGGADRTFTSDTMFLQTIANKVHKNQNSKATNDVSDIVGAQPFLRKSQANKIDYMSPNDIIGARPKSLHPKKNKISYNLRNDDIEGSRPADDVFKTKRKVDIMNPKYDLPHAELLACPPPKYIRDSFSVDDISGTKPAKYYKWKERNSQSTDDIEGAQADFKPRHKRITANGPQRNTLDVSDILKTGFVTQRTNDPLDPVHIIHGQVHRLDETSKPKALPVAHSIDYRYSTKDIPGGTSGYKPCNIATVNRRHFRKTNELADIHGAHADSYKPYPRFSRQTNPLVPVYTNLDGIPILNDFCQSTIPTTNNNKNNAEAQKIVVVPESNQAKDQEITRLKEEIEKLASRVSTAPSVNNNNNENNNGTRAIKSAVGSSRADLLANRASSSTPREDSRSNSLSSDARRDNEQVKADVAEVLNLPLTPLPPINNKKYM